jgi:hypothetical protein
VIRAACQPMDEPAGNFIRLGWTAYAWRWLSPDTAGAVAEGQQDPRPGNARF